MSSGDEWRDAEADRIPSPGGWEVPAGERAGWTWVPPWRGAQPVPERMPVWVRVWYRTPLIDRFASEWMWFHGGFLVFPPEHPWSRGEDDEMDEYEQRVLESVRHGLVDETVHLTPIDGPARTVRGLLASYDGTLDSVALEFVESDSYVVVRFRMSERSGARFAMRLRIWPDEPEETPEEDGQLMASNFDEEIATKWWKWKDCAPDADGLVWAPDASDF